MQETSKPEESEKSELQRLAWLGTMELVELWERPMPAATRARVLAELTQRGYRTKGLPAPPPEDAKVDPLPTLADRDAGRMHGSATLLLLVGIGQLVFSAYWFWKLRENGILPALVGSFIHLTIGVAFLTLYRTARKKPHPALTVGFVLYAALQALQYALVASFADDAGNYVGSLPVVVGALLALGLGAEASRRRDKTG